jgi:RNA polymerase sigma-70 factor (ECF subfamily)
MESAGRPADERDLVERSLQGDAAAFGALAGHYYRPVGAFLLKRLGRADLVEDLVQETFLEAFRALRAGRRPEHFSSWLFGIAHNRCGKYLRRKRPVLFGDDPPVEAAVPDELDARAELEEQEKLLRSLDAGLADLPEETRRLLQLKHQHGKTCEQIATELGRPVGTVKSLLSRTYKVLRARLGFAGEDGP